MSDDVLDWDLEDAREPVDEPVVDKASDLAHDLHMHFLSHNFGWRYGKELRTPLPDEIQEGIDKLIERISGEPDGTGIESGRIYINKTDGEYNVYAHFGTTSR